MSAYVLRFGKNKETDMLTQFNDGETARMNLTRIIPKAIGQGYLPESCSADKVELFHNEKIVNLDLSLKEQGINEYEILVLEDRSALVNLSIRYKPDKSNEILETVAVRPFEILRDELEEFGEQVVRKHRFYGRKPKQGKIRYRHNRRKLDLERSLASQGIREDIEVHMTPGILFEWPPGLHWPPGPYTTYCITAAVVAVVIAFILLHLHASRRDYPVRLACEQECTFRDAEGTVYDNESTVSLPVGDHTFEVYPKGFPIFEEVIEVKPHVFGSDVLQFAPPLNPQGRFRDRMVIKEFRIIACDNETGDRLPKGPDVKINGFRHITTHYSEAMLEGIGLPVGAYVIRFDYPDSLLERINFGGNWRYPTGQESDFLFDLKDPAFLREKNITFYYSTPR
jgi:hypothetical protein